MAEKLREQIAHHSGRSPVTPRRSAQPADTTEDEVLIQRRRAGASAQSYTQTRQPVQTDYDAEDDDSLYIQRPPRSAVRLNNPIHVQNAHIQTRRPVETRVLQRGAPRWVFVVLA